MSAHTDIAKIKIAAKQLGIPDDDGNAAAGVLSTYRQMLQSLTGKTSVGADVMTDAERSTVLRHLARKGFKSKPGRRRPAKAPGMASQGKIGLIYVLWQALGDGGALEAPGRESLAAWVRHQTQRYNNGAGYSAPEFLPTAAADQLIEQLKLWCQRQKVTWK